MLEEEERGRGTGGGFLRRGFELRTHQLESPRRGREGGVSSSVEGSCDRGGGNNAKGREGQLRRGENGAREE